ncbi:MAG: DUF4332 domain-containing protein, partial [Deltaproteobacteria bacterium]|nr:DUF4332 domain-containing protein [Deltaproteobacteria bacterium]
MKLSFLKEAIVIAAFLAMPLSAAASAYDLEFLDFIEAKDVASLRKEKIITSDELYNAMKAKDKGKKLSKKTGIPMQKLSEWAKFCDLLRIKGVGPKLAKLLGIVGVQTTKDLASQNPQELLKKISEANEKHELL